jgi:hypothetical protein
MKYWLAVLILSILFCGCSMQKRHYENGFYSDWNKKGKKTDVDGKEHGQNDSTTSIKSPQKNIAEKKTGMYQSGSPAMDSTLVLPKEKSIPICDTIILSGGERVVADIQEITLRQIKYKLCDDGDGPLRIVNKDNVSEIHHSGGAKETFNTGDSKSPRRSQRAGSDHGPRRPGMYNSMNYNEREEMVMKLSDDSRLFGAFALGCSITFFPLGIIFGLIAVLKGKKAIRLMEGDDDLTTRYGQKAHMGVNLGFVAILLPVAIFLLMIFLFSMIH